MAVPFQRVLGATSSRVSEPSTCEACGEPFTCGATLGACWCSEVKVSEDVRADLRTKHKQCLCRACLERAASSTAV